MKEDAESKARRRKSVRASFPIPLTQVALRHVDTVQSLDSDQRDLLAKTLARVGMDHLVRCLASIRNSGGAIKTETDLIAALHLTELLQDSHSQENDVDFSSDSQGVQEVDSDYLASLLIECHPDMPQATAEALAGSDVMAPCLQVVSTTRFALRDAKSDFVITALYTLFEEKLDEIEQIIANNPAFIKAMQLSRADWKPN